ncbi:hypothetical protein H4R19_000976 [Coemansia spiralis]|nr:hypothetical protein H4R19_000976 [Coemansia spiralis]
MTGETSSAIPLPAERAPLQAPKEAKAVLTFSPSTRFPTTPPVESDEAASDPDDQVASQLESTREQLRRDKARDAIRKEQVHMEGFLNKKAGGANKAWNKRWCVLRSQALLIYKRYSEEKLKRIIRADEIVDVRSTSRRNREFAFEIETPERSFCFEASSDHELESWVTRLRAVVSVVNTAAAADTANAAVPRRSSDSRYATGTVSAAAGTAGPFRSLPAAPRRAHDASTPVQTMFATSPDTDDGLATDSKAPATAPIQMPTALGLRIDVTRPPGAVQPSAAGATALPPGIGPDHEPVPVADGEDGGEEDDDEPNFSEDQRRDIETRLDEDRVIQRGYLLKQDKLRQWRRRWFVLRQNTLSYYHDDKEYEVKQILRHHDVYDVRAPDPSTAKAKSLSRTYFKIVAAKRNYWLAHDDAAIASEWFAALLRWSAPDVAYPRALPAASTMPVGPHSLPIPPAIVAHRVFSPATSPAAPLDHPPRILRHASATTLSPPPP